MALDQNYSSVIRQSATQKNLSVGTWAGDKSDTISSACRDTRVKQESKADKTKDFLPPKYVESRGGQRTMINFQGPPCHL